MIKRLNTYSLRSLIDIYTMLQVYIYRYGFEKTGTGWKLLMFEEGIENMYVNAIIV